MCMGGPAPHTRVSISGFEWPIGQNKPEQGQNYFALIFLAQKCPFLTLKTLFSVRVHERQLSPSPVFLRNFETLFLNFLIV